MKKYQYIIIGGGAAGFSSIIKLTELTGGDADILLVSKGALGGTCVNTGCVPSKALIETAKHLYNLKKFSDRGIDIDGYSLNFTDLFRSIRKMVSNLRNRKYEEILSRLDNVDYVEGEARFTGPNTIEVDDGEEHEYQGEKILIATGSRPSIPPIKGVDEIRYLTTQNIWNLDYKPSSIAVIGAGAVGLELSQALNRLGVEIHLIEMMDKLTPYTEPEISNLLEKTLVEEGVNLYLKSIVKEVSKEGSKIVVNFKTKNENRNIIVDELLITAGRKPNTEKLNLPRAGVETDDKGFIKVDSRLKTSNPHVYAAGDVAGTPKPAMLETLAAREGATAAYNMLGKSSKEIDYNTVPVTIFTDPEIAYVGKTEVEVMNRLGVCSCRTVYLKDIPKSSIINQFNGVAKIIVNPHTYKVEGVHVMAPNASEIILQASLYIKKGYTIYDIINTIQVFPTVSELIKVAAQAFIRKVDEMPCCVE